MNRRPKFRIGNKVILRDIDNFTYYENMHQPGDIVTIASVLRVPGEKRYAYHIEEDEFLYAEYAMDLISDEEPIETPQNNTIFVTNATSLLIAIRNLINSYLDTRLPPED